MCGVRCTASRPASPAGPFAAWARLAGALLVLAAVQAPELPAAAKGAAEAERVVARVDAEPISAAEVERELARVLKDRKVEPEAKRVLRQEALQQLVNRRLVLKYLAQNGLAANPAEVTQAVNRLKKQVERQQQTWADYLKQTGISEAELKHGLAWELSWQRCLEKHLTDVNLERFFTQHRREFDGTTLRVAHILFKVVPPKDAGALEQAVAKAEQVRQGLQAGKLTFAEAAQRHSAAPSAKQGGELGEIARREPMPEPFSQAAFALEKGQISQPVITPFGVHLIQCQELSPGKKTWTEVRGDLEQAVTQYLFQWMADRQRPKATVELLEPQS